MEEMQALVKAVRDGPSGPFLLHDLENDINPGSILELGLPVASCICSSCSASLPGDHGASSFANLPTVVCIHCWTS